MKSETTARGGGRAGASRRRVAATRREAPHYSLATDREPLSYFQGCYLTARWPREEEGADNTSGCLQIISLERTAVTEYTPVRSCCNFCINTYKDI